MKKSMNIRLQKKFTDDILGSRYCWQDKSAEKSFNMGLILAATS